MGCVWLITFMPWINRHLPQYHSLVYLCRWVSCWSTLVEGPPAISWRSGFQPPTPGYSQCRHRWRQGTAGRSRFDCFFFILCLSLGIVCSIPNHDHLPLCKMHLSSCSSMHIFSQPITWQQLSACRHGNAQTLAKRSKFFHTSTLYIVCSPFFFLSRSLLGVKTVCVDR